MARKKRRIEKNSVKKRSQKLKPMKIAALIVSAIQDLREMKGSPCNKIIGYIGYTSNMADSRVKRQVKAALKRGVDYGILRKYRGHYFLPTGDEVDRANRVAVRFASLPVRHSIESSPISTHSVTPLRVHKKSGFRIKSRRTKRLTKPRSTLISSVASLTEKLYGADSCGVC